MVTFRSRSLASWFFFAKKKHFIRFSTVVLLLVLVSSGVSFAVSDVTPPTISALDVTPTSVDVTSVATTVTVTATIADDISGVSFAGVRFTSPSKTRFAETSLSPAGGTSYTANLTVSAFTEPGTWTPSVYLIDNAGNAKSLSSTDLQALGISPTLAVASVLDSMPPTITQFNLSANSFDVTAGPATFNVSATITDDISGVSFAAVRYSSPSGKQFVERPFTPAGSNIYSTDLTLPQYAESGTWSPSVYLVDNAGSVRSLSTLDLMMLGLNQTISVTSTPDTTPPSVTNISLSGLSLDTSTGPGVLTITATITDDLSGVNFAALGFQSPSGVQTISSQFLGADGSNNFTLRLTMPASVESGIWNAFSFYVVDNAGNSRNYSLSDLSSLGLLTQLAVSKVNLQTVAPGGSVTSDVEGDGATVKDPLEVTVTTPNGGSVNIVVTQILGALPSGYQFLGKQINIGVSAATDVNPLKIEFLIDSSIIPAGETDQTLQVFKNGVVVPDCSGPPGIAQPDPCVSGREALANHGIHLTILSSTASSWAMAASTAQVSPVVQINCPANPIVGHAASASWTASDPNGDLIGPASGTVSLDTGSVGQKTAQTPTISDAFGHTASASCGYSVVNDPSIILWKFTILPTGNGTVTSDVPGINCGSTCQASFLDATVVTLSAAASPGSHFVGWSGGCLGTAPCRFTLNGAAKLIATFALDPELTVNTPTGGRVTSLMGPPIDCGTTCSADVPDGTLVTLHAQPDADHYFKGWSGACSGLANCSLTLSPATHVSALFDYQPKFTVYNSGGGRVTSNPSGLDCGAVCVTRFMPGTILTLSAQPDPGFRFTGWSAGCLGTAPCRLTLTGAAKVAATFAPL